MKYHRRRLDKIKCESCGISIPDKKLRLCDMCWARVEREAREAKVSRPA